MELEAISSLSMLPGCESLFVCDHHRHFTLLNQVLDVQGGVALAHRRVVEERVSVEGVYDVHICVSLFKQNEDRVELSVLNCQV